MGIPNVTFRDAPAPVVDSGVTLPEPEKNDIQVQSAADDTEPIELRDTNGRSVVLDALNIDDNLNTLPQEDKSNVSEVKEYIMDIMKSRGLPMNVQSFKKILNNVKMDMGLDMESEPSVVLDRVSGVVRAWKSLSFLTDPAVKKSIFMKLANMKSSADMNREVYRVMEQYKVWR